MAFMSLEKNFFLKKTIFLFLFIFALFLFVYLLSGFFNERSINKLLVFGEGAIEHILRANSISRASVWTNVGMLNPKTIRIVMSRSFFKKQFDLFYILFN